MGSCRENHWTDGKVFYGRYLRKLSNVTQEAIGDMSKARSSLSRGSEPTLITDSRREAQRLQNSVSLQRSESRGQAV